MDVQQKICSGCVMLSRQYGPKSHRNVSRTLLNLCHKGLRQFWGGNGIQTGTSKVNLCAFWWILLNIDRLAPTPFKTVTF